MFRFRRGFTLVEMLVVISIIGMLATLLLPAAMKSRENGRRAKCSNNLHQIMIAMTAYEAKYRTLPPGRVGCDCYEVKGIAPCKGLPATKRPGTSGFALILPELDEVPTYQRFANFVKGGVFPGDWGVGYKSTDPKTGAAQFEDSQCDDATGWQSVGGVTTAINSRPAVFNCPSSPNTGGGNSYYGRGINAGTTSYAMSMGSGVKRVNANVAGTSVSTAYLSMDQVKYANNGPFIYKIPRTSSAVLDGVANTIFLGEVRYTNWNGNSNRWALGWRLMDSLRMTAITPNWNNPINSGDFNPTGGWDYSTPGNTYKGYFTSEHREGAHFAFGDGHVQYLKNDIDVWLYRSLGTMANGPNEAGYLTPPSN